VAVQIRRQVIVEEKMQDAYGNILIARQELKLNKK